MKNFNKNYIIVIVIFIIIVLLVYFNIHKEKDEQIDLTQVYEEIEQEENVENKKKIVVHVIGEVKKPGIVTIEEEGRIIDVIEMAGGITENADLSKVNLAYVVSDGQKIYIPSYNDKIEEYIEETAGEGIIIQGITKSSKININTATRNRVRNFARNRTINSTKNNYI